MLYSNDARCYWVSWLLIVISSNHRHRPEHVYKLLVFRDYIRLGRQGRKRYGIRISSPTTSSATWIRSSRSSTSSSTRWCRPPTPSSIESPRPAMAFAVTGLSCWRQLQSSYHLLYNTGMSDKHSNNSLPKVCEPAATNRHTAVPMQ